MRDVDLNDDDDLDASPSVELLMAVPAEQRVQFERLRDMAALKNIHLSPSSTDDGLVGFKLERAGKSVRCPDIESLKAQLIAHGIPILTAEAVQQLLREFQGSFMRSMDGAAGAHGDH